MEIELFPPYQLFGIQDKRPDDNLWGTSRLPITDQFDHPQVEDDAVEMICNFFIGKETGFPWYKKRRVKLVLISKVKSEPDIEATGSQRILLFFKDKKWKLFS